MSKQCECCLSPNNLTELTEDHVNLIVSCFSVDVSRISSFDKSSNYICNMCTVKIKESFSFRSQILISQIKLKKKYFSTIDDIESNKIIIESDPLKQEFLSDCEDTHDYDISIEENNISPQENLDFQMDQKNDSNDLPITEIKSNYDKLHNSNNSKRNWIVQIHQENESNVNKSITQKESTAEFENLSESNHFNSDEADSTCEICNKTFTNNSQLLLHKQIHLSKYVCDICGKDFKQRAMLIRHVRIHLDYSRCDVCSKLIKPSYMSRHLKTHSGSVVYYKCSHCSEKLTTLALKFKHLSTVHKIEIRRYRCETCPKKFFSPKQLRDHIDRSHLKKLNAACELCGLKFFDMQAVKRHMGAHSEERNFSCQFCHKRYKKKSHLKEHLPSHFGEKFKCNQCDSEYSNRNNLLKHIRTKHV